MRSGRLDNMIVLHAWDFVIDSRSGQKEEGWVEIQPAWASVEPLRGQELYTAQQQNSLITTRIVLRWDEELFNQLCHTSSATYRGIRYQLMHDPINTNMDNREIQLLCKVVR